MAQVAGVTAFSLRSANLKKLSEFTGFGIVRGIG